MRVEGRWSTGWVKHFPSEVGEDGRKEIYRSIEVLQERCGRERARALTNWLNWRLKTVGGRERSTESTTEGAGY